MKILAVLAALCIPSCTTTPGRPFPIEDGEYGFQHRFSEHPEMHSIDLVATIKGNHITLTNNDRSDVFPIGVIAEGTIMWHSKSRQWIIGDSTSDSDANEIGSCSEGPEVVDLQQRVYWTC